MLVFNIILEMDNEEIKEQPNEEMENNSNSTSEFNKDFKPLEKLNSKPLEKLSSKPLKRLKPDWKKEAAKQSLLKAITPILIYVGLFLLILFIIIGIIMFLQTMPGIVMQDLKGKFAQLGNNIVSFFGADTTKLIEEKEIYGVLDELEAMGYDLKGYGFLTEYVDKDVEGNLEDDEDDGVLRNDDDTIKEAKSDYIIQYIISDNYVYTLKNENLATVSGAESLGGKAKELRKSIVNSNL